MSLNTVQSQSGPRLLGQRRARLLACASLITASFLWPITSLALEPATGSPLLTVTGKIKHPNAGPKAQFDAPLLEALPQHSFVTGTPWHKGTKTYSGPLLRDVLAAAGAAGQTVHAVALNDYKVSIPFEDAQKHDVIVVLLINGQPLTVREKGPLLIMYPFDQRPALRTALYYNRCIWQLRSLDVQ